MTLRLMPDAEALFRGYLLGAPEITALVGQRVVQRIPDVPVWPLIRLTRVAGVTEPWHDSPVLSVECWADEYDNDLALDIARTVAALVWLCRGTFTALGGVAVSAEIVSGPFRSDDPDTARVRYILDARLTTLAV